MSLSNVAEAALVALWLNGTTWDGVAVNDTTSPLTNMQESLHTADPGEAGNQTSNECAYGSYARNAVARTSAGYTCSGNTATHTSTASFPTATSGTETCTYMGIGASPTGVGELHGSGTVTPNISISSTVTPELTTGTTITLD